MRNEKLDPVELPEKLRLGASRHGARIRIGVFLLVLFIFLSTGAFASAQTPPALPAAPSLPPPTPRVTLTEPIISISPEDFKPLEEFLYVEGYAVPNATVHVEFQKQGEKPVKFSVKALSNGEWTVSGKTFLSTGYWEIRARQQVGAEVSDWSNPRVIRSIVTGVTFLGFTVRYVVIAAILFAFLFIIAAIFFYFLRRIRRFKEQLFATQLHETQDRYRKGFAEIRKDLMDELKLLSANAQGRPLTPEELERKDHILRELDELEQTLSQDMGNIGKKL